LTHQPFVRVQEGHAAAAMASGGHPCAAEDWTCTAVETPPQDREDQVHHVPGMQVRGAVSTSLSAHVSGICRSEEVDGESTMTGHQGH